eukprot:GFUD01131393.1.p1 GENE.GFUD01131393.1~~GFUD01131393.1.p1  ORF type:complete len:103 (-),score=40.24 GFUD01131393.1:7-315(-)
MPGSTLTPLLLVIMWTSLTICSPLPLAVESCKPDNISTLPIRMQNICLSLLNKISEFESELESLSDSNDSDYSPDYPEYHIAGDKRKDPDHVFLRFGRGGRD